MGFGTLIYLYYGYTYGAVLLKYYKKFVKGRHKKVYVM